MFDYGEHWVLVACTVGAALVGIVTFGSLAGSMLPFISETDWFRSGERLGALCGDARRCHGARDLFQHRAYFLEGNASLMPPRLLNLG